MKRDAKIAGVYIVIFFGLIIAPFSQPKVPVRTKEFMRQKLEHSQKLLTALTTEDYFTLGNQAERLSAMTQDANWKAFQNPDYVQFSGRFRVHVDELSRASKEKNIDAATLAYVRMTMSCVDCHKFVRGRLIAEMPLDSAEKFAARGR